MPSNITCCCEISMVCKYFGPFSLQSKDYLDHRERERERERERARERACRERRRVRAGEWKLSVHIKTRRGGEDLERERGKSL